MVTRDQMLAMGIAPNDYYERVKNLWEAVNEQKERGSGMKIHKTDSGFQRLEFKDHNGEPCSLQQSSAVGDYKNSLACPGSSYVWLGMEPHRAQLDREQVKDLIKYLTNWLKRGKF